MSLSAPGHPVQRTLQDAVQAARADNQVEAIPLMGESQGDPMHDADSMGLSNIVQDINAFADQDPLFWKPAPLLERLLAEGRDFSSLNQAPRP